jgi:Na+-transporting methylmalonyl-CoA/oxaloacetate decarboxylase gamma subunit
MNMRLGSILFLTILIYVVETSAYASRLAGIRTRRPSQANSFYNLLALSARAAKALQTTLLAGLVDRAVTTGQVTNLTTTLRLVLLAAAGGVIIGAGLVPSIARLLERAVHSYEQRRSLPRVVLHGLGIETLPRARKDLRPPRARTVLWASRHRLPWRWILLTVVVATLSAVGGPAAQIASAITPEGARTALTLPAFFTGVGTVLLVLLVDPLTAHVMDQALRGERPVSDVTAVTVWQIGGRLAGTLLTQLLLSPLAQLLATLARWLVQ